MIPSLRWLFLKRMLLLFWAVWLSLVVATNVADGLKVVGILPATCPFASGNYDAIKQVTMPFGVSSTVVALLFVGVVLWEALTMVLFWYTGLTFQGTQPGGHSGPLVLTFTVSLALWGAFQLACEALPSPLAYQIAGVHRQLFGVQLLTLLALVLLPHD